MLKSKLRKAIAVAALGLSFNVYASGVPTVDVASFAALMQQFQTLTQQLSEMKENVNQLTSLGDNFKNQFKGKIDSYLDLINNTSFTKTAEGYLPDNAAEVLAVIKNGTSDNPEIQRTINQIMNDNSSLSKIDEGKLKETLQYQRRRAAAYQANAQAAYNAAVARQKKGQELAEQSASVSSEKEGRALGLAMQAQTNTALNELTKQQALDQIHKAQKDKEEQDKAEEVAAVNQQSCKEYIKASGLKVDYNDFPGCK